MNKKKHKLDPNWVTGFVDAEGCFHIRIAKRKDFKIGWKVQASLQIKLNIRDKDLLMQIKSFFNEEGKINICNNEVSYRVFKLNAITQVIIPPFDKYPLITQKQSDFLLFKIIVELMNKGEHLKKESLVKIVNYRASLNKGLSGELKTFFPNGISTKRSNVSLPKNIDYNWIAGFTSGDGCFSINISKDKGYKNGYSVKLRVSISQHNRDSLLMNHLIKVLGCGNIYYNKAIVDLIVSNFNDIYDKIIPLFNEYKIEGVKYLDFEYFCKVAELVNKGAHLTLEGLEEIREIKSKMNKYL